MLGSYKSLPAAPGFGRGKVIPERQAWWFSRLVFQWLMPFLDVGYSRPLEKEDLWEFPEDFKTYGIANWVEANFFKRCPPEQRPSFLRPKKYNTSGAPSDSSYGWGGRGPDLESAAEAIGNKWSRKGKVVQDSSLANALHETFFYRWWFAGFLRLCSDTLRATTPLVAKVLLTWLTRCYVWSRLTDVDRAASPERKPQGVGYGVGLAFGLFLMQETASLMTNHYMHISMITGLFARTGVVGTIFRKSLRLSARARLKHPPGQITAMISSDVIRIDWFAAVGHALWVSPIQIVIGSALLIANLGYAGVVGLGILLLGLPLQFLLVKVMYAQRQRGVTITDSRLQLTTEVLQGIRLVKYYAWERFYMDQVQRLREREIRSTKATAIARSSLIALVTLTPILASVLSFIVYAVLGNPLTVPIVFSSLQLFNVIRTPLAFLPNVFSSLADVLIALGRISKFLTAEELDEPYKIEDAAEWGVDAEGDFLWETVRKEKEEQKVERKSWRHRYLHLHHGHKGKHDIFRSGEAAEVMAPASAASEESMEMGKGKHEERPFGLRNVSVRIPRGAFVAVVGRVGSGKSSLLQALIGEMRRTSGQVVFSGAVAYVPQTVWIRNASIRENIIAGEEEDEDRFQQVVKACSLQHDLETLPYGEATEIGEKGINLSGGQQARVALARAAYSKTDVVLLDDTLSALDAYVGQAIVKNCILGGPLAGRTRILVTHALHVLDRTDYIYVMDNGSIIEQGTYDALTRDSIVFARLIEEYGTHESEESETSRMNRRKGTVYTGDSKKKEKKPQRSLIQSEERVTGSVSWATYAKYFRFAGSVLWAPAIIVLVLLTQASSVGNNLFLGFWTSQSISGFSQVNYMAVYAALGVAQAIFAFSVSAALALAGLKASQTMFEAAFRGVLRSPESFFDTTPVGRILARLSKDQDVLDTELTALMSQFLYSFGSILAVITLTFYTFPPLGAIFLPMILLYSTVSGYYRRSSVETQRLDSLLRSSLFSLYSETLTGLPTIRAYGEQVCTVRNIEQRLDLENRASYMTLSIQRWLSTRLDLSGNVLILGIALFAVGLRNSISPSKVGVLLSYTLSITQLFSDMVSQHAKNEQNMNAAERVLVYTELPSEGDPVTSNDPPSSWPEKGAIQFAGVDMAYREGLPLVLKHVTFEVRPGEKVGIVGRTGAGKSSLLQALFRMVELQQGQIMIDGYNICNIGLDILRSSLALVPQDSILFLGTLRDNLDPLGTRTDAELISVLQRAYLLPPNGALDPISEAKFSLDSIVGDEGLNYSAGERQLLSLCRAMVKNSTIIVLDEATSNVDAETDSKIQKTIQIEFAASTMLCIAHRLNTVASYDRVLVMDAGRVAEFDTVLNLFDQPGSIFRSLCNEAGLSRQDILYIRDRGMETLP